MYDSDTRLIPAEIPPNPIYDPPRVIDGLYTWRLVAVDAAGNTSSVASASVRLDSDTPIIHLCRADGGQTDLGFTTNHIFRLQFHATDGSGAFTYTATVNSIPMLQGTDDGDAPMVLPITMPTTDAFSYAVVLTVTDQAGHSATANCSIPRAHPPAQPVALIPNRYVYNDDLELRASSFVDPDPVDFAAAVHWIVRDDRGVPVVDTGSVAPSSDRQVLPKGTFAARDYSWTLRYQDRFGLWSPWASSSWFHVYDSTDSDRDGLPDDYEIVWFGGLGETAASDFDHDHMSNGDEYHAGTAPNNPESRLQITRLVRESGAMAIEWSSVPGLNYALERRAADSGGAWSPISPLVTGEPGPLTQFTDPVGTNRWPWLRVRCVPPGTPWP